MPLVLTPPTMQPTSTRPSRRAVSATTGAISDGRSPSISEVLLDPPPGAPDSRAISAGLAHGSKLGDHHRPGSLACMAVTAARTVFPVWHADSRLSAAAGPGLVQARIARGIRTEPAESGVETPRCLWQNPRRSESKSPARSLRGGAGDIGTCARHRAEWRTKLTSQGCRHGPSAPQPRRRLDSRRRSLRGGSDLPVCSGPGALPSEIPV